MNIWDKFASWLIKVGQRTPYFHLNGYMERWWLFGSKRTDDESKENEWPIKGRIHHILRSDNDRHMHDHPMWNISLVLKGGYWEHLPVECNEYGMPIETTRVWRGPGSIVFRRARSLHRLELPEGETAWSLFIMGPKSQDWGFYTEVGKVKWTDYNPKLAYRIGAQPYGVAKFSDGIAQIEIGPHGEPLADAEVQIFKKDPILPLPIGIYKDRKTA